MKQNNCYCHSGKFFDECCHPFLSGKLKPSGPEELMRSRFSAFCTKNIEYLIATRHMSMRQIDERQSLLKTIENTQWIGLTVIKAAPPQKNQGHVEYAAFYKTSYKTDNIGQLHENARFVLENGQWYYLDGRILEPVRLTRNEPCWCGSKKKYKKCHGK